MAFGPVNMGVMAGTIQTVETLRGPAGRLEALLNVGAADAAYSAVVCHPHPPSGGTMHTKVVYHAAKAFSHFGVPVLRFNFRGTGLSEGTHDHGPGEIADVKAALDWLQHEFGLPILLAGFSFGANIGFRAACGDERVKGLVGLGMPLSAGGRSYSYEFMKRCTQPKLLLTGSEDPFAPRAVMEQVFREAPGETEMQWIDGAEHFFAGVPGSPAMKLDQMRLVMQDWLGRKFFHQ
ncbi:alpha/beta hydrolase [Terriglobus sp. ADX1]|uniref:alpha/beta hydrolase n=1 Tax=Terriglobus sp. ADX1 TaxID=2794063 RepID=UPI002FE5DE5F